MAPLTHSGDSRLARHTGNAVLKEEARGARLAKERRDSPRRIDTAVAAVMAHDRAAALAPPGTVSTSSRIDCVKTRLVTKYPIGI